MNAQIQEVIEILEGTAHTRRIARALKILKTIVAVSRPDRKSK